MAGVRDSDDEEETRDESGAAKLLMGAVLLLAVAATAVLVLSDSAKMLRLGVLAALWAALLGVFLASKFRKLVAEKENEVADLQSVYELELEREVAARREHELEIEAEARKRVEEANREDLAELRAELRSLRESLERLTGGEVLVERFALQARSTRMRTLAGPEAQPRVVPADRRSIVAGEPPTLDASTELLARPEVPTVSPSQAMPAASAQSRREPPSPQPLRVAGSPAGRPPTRQAAQSTRTVGAAQQPTRIVGAVQQPTRAAAQARSSATGTGQSIRSVGAPQPPTRSPGAAQPPTRAGATGQPAGRSASGSAAQSPGRSAATAAQPPSSRPASSPTRTTSAAQPTRATTSVPGMSPVRPPSRPVDDNDVTQAWPAERPAPPQARRPTAQQPRRAESDLPADATQQVERPWPTPGDTGLSARLGGPVQQPRTRRAADPSPPQVRRAVQPQRIDQVERSRHSSTERPVETTGGHRRIDEPTGRTASGHRAKVDEPARWRDDDPETTGAHTAGRSVTEILAAHANQEDTPRRHRRRGD